MKHHITLNYIFPLFLFHKKIFTSTLSFTGNNFRSNILSKIVARGKDVNQQYDLSFMFPPPSSSSLSGSISSSTTTDDFLDDIRAMRVKDIKAELTSLGISTADLFEKDDLVKRLLDARVEKTNENENSEIETSPDSKATVSADTILNDIRSMRVRDIKSELSSLGISTKDLFEKEDLVKRLLDARMNGSSNSMSCDENKLEVPLNLYSLDSAQSVNAVNNDNIFLRPSPGKFGAIKIHHPESQKDLLMLVDTACSGTVLSPSAVSRLGLKLYDTPVTMTAAGGTNLGGTKLSQIDNFMISGRKFDRPMPIAVQDIGGLPNALDGILGLSFLSQVR